MRRILLVEDHLDLAGLIQACLATEGFEVLRAASGEEAVRLAGEAAPDLMVLDLVLPGGDGFEVVRRLRSDPRVAHLPLVVHSALEVEPRQRDRLRLGPTRFVAKPTASPEEFLAQVRELLGLSRPF